MRCLGRKKEKVACDSQKSFILIRISKACVATYASRDAHMPRDNFDEHGVDIRRHVFLFF